MSLPPQSCIPKRVTPEKGNLLFVKYRIFNLSVGGSARRFAPKPYLEMPVREVLIARLPPRELRCFYRAEPWDPQSVK